MVKIAIADALEGFRGSYAPNQFIIYLSENTPFFYLESEDDARQNNHFLSVFLHEYWHYWMNVSTLSGFKAFSFSQNYIADFSYSLVSLANGESTGDVDLPDDLKKRVFALIRLYQHHQGNARFRDSRNVSDFAISSVDTKNATVLINDREAPDPRTELTLSYAEGGRADIQSCRFILGTAAIEESVCAAIQEIIEEQLPPETRLARFLPPVPYRMITKLVNYFEPDIKPRPKVIASLGTLALLTPHPGNLAPKICEAYAKKHQAGMTDEEILSVLCDWLANEMQNIVGPMLNQDVQELKKLHHGRGLMEKASAYLIGNMSSHLHHRIAEPLFDMKTFWPKFDYAKFITQQEVCPPCDIIQRRQLEEDMIGKDFHVSIGLQIKDEDGYRPTDYLRVQQAQQDYVFAHLDVINRGFIPTSAIKEHICPYYSQCKLQNRVENATECKTAPWRAYSGSREACQYRAAVNSTIGPVTIEPLRPF